MLGLFMDEPVKAGKLDNILRLAIGDDGILVVFRRTTPGIRHGDRRSAAASLNR